jgi:hypothetical protein
MYLVDEALNGMKNLGRKGLSSLANFIKIFLKHWDPHYEEGKYEEIFEDLMAALNEEDIVIEASTSSPLEDKAHEEAPHVFIENSFSAIHGEDIVDEASISSTQEDKGLVSCVTFQNSDFDSTFSCDFKKLNFEDKPLHKEECLDLFKGN